MDLNNHFGNPKSFNISLISVGWEFSDCHLFLFGMLFTDYTDKEWLSGYSEGSDMQFPYKGLGKILLEFTDKDCKIIMGN